MVRNQAVREYLTFGLPLNVNTPAARALVTSGSSTSTTPRAGSTSPSSPPGSGCGGATLRQAQVWSRASCRTSCRRWPRPAPPTATRPSSGTSTGHGRPRILAFRSHRQTPTGGAPSRRSVGVRLVPAHTYPQNGRRAPMWGTGEVLNLELCWEQGRTVSATRRRRATSGRSIKRTNGESPPRL